LPLVWLLFLIPAVSLAATLYQTPVQASSMIFSIYSLQDSSLVKMLRQTALPDLPIYSNCQRCLYIYDNIHPAAIFDEDPNDKPFMPATEQDLPALLIWFNQVRPGKTNLSAPRPLPDLNRLLGMQVRVSPLVETNDGGVYQLSPTKTP
jgi:hypothetical protein